MIISISSGLRREIHNVIEYLKRTDKHHNIKINIPMHNEFINSNRESLTFQNL